MKNQAFLDEIALRLKRAEALLEDARLRRTAAGESTAQLTKLQTKKQKEYLDLKHLRGRAQEEFSKALALEKAAEKDVFALRETMKIYRLSQAREEPSDDSEEHPEVPDFRVGDKVLFEADKDCYPRWSYDIQVGRPTGISRRGTVEEIDYNLHELTTRSRFGEAPATLTWVWPLPGHEDYDPKQWERPGYLRLLDE